MEPEYSAVLLRYGEIGIKSRQTRKHMVDLLVKHVGTALREKGTPFDRIRTEYGRIFIETSDAPRAAAVASRVFGIVSVSPVIVVESAMEKILEMGLLVAQKHFTRGKSFAVRASRLGSHAYTSQEIREQLGARILEGLSELELRVDLDSPDQYIYVEVRNDRAYLFTQTVKGVGGMPTGSQGTVVCLISSGLDSPVAAYKAMKRGCIPVFVTFDNMPYSNEACANIAVKQASLLAQYIYDHEVKMYIVPHGLDLTDIVDHVPQRMTCLYCKRNMFRLGREVAIRENADAIVTGEIIGEQASQTSRNLRATSSAVCDFPILRPCIGEDKVDIEHLGMEIGTYQFAKENVSCCTLPPKYPVVRANIDEVGALEGGMDLSVLDKEISLAKVIVLRSVE
ncbi:MAG: tRNA 4-thiouridine(8) synthase ThiI [Candidatus Thorarchaeota archaeon]|nr:MAG: tRNA 4-thiouridine(8) synthase ThiI [Candidatus Thorarchaeota archaeon]